MAQPASTCGICLHAINISERCQIKCQHDFHLECILRWLKEPNARSKCPLCRSTIHAIIDCSENDVLVMENEFLDYMEKTIVSVEDPTKIILFRDLKEVFENSKFFANLPAKCRRHSKRYLKKQIESIRKYRNACEPRRKRINGVRRNNFLKGFEFKAQWHQEKYDITWKMFGVNDPARNKRRSSQSN